MMIKLGLVWPCLAFALALSSVSACDSADRIYDCASICDAYRDCLNEDYDVGACTTRCNDNASRSNSFKDRADACQKCINDRSCAGAVFGCAADCAGIVP
jgi:hypothetical protein